MAHVITEPCIGTKDTACVEVCPVEARIFGDLSDEESPISKFNRENAMMAIKPHLKTGAKVLYKGLTKEVV